MYKRQKLLPYRNFWGHVHHALHMQEHDNKEFLKTGKVNDHSKIVTCKSVLGDYWCTYFLKAELGKIIKHFFHRKWWNFFFTHLKFIKSSHDYTLEPYMRSTMYCLLISYCACPWLFIVYRFKHNRVTMTITQFSTDFCLSHVSWIKFHFKNQTSYLVRKDFDIK